MRRTDLNGSRSDIKRRSSDFVQTAVATVLSEFPGDHQDYEVRKSVKTYFKSIGKTHAKPDTEQEEARMVRSSTARSKWVSIFTRGRHS